MDFKLKEFIDKSNKIVIFSGAGVSAESGVPTFRGEGGLYTGDNEYKMMAAMTRRLWNSSKHVPILEELFAEINNSEPTSAHKFAKELQDAGKLHGLVTQNIDSLYEKAGVSNVIHVHGEGNHYRCDKCKNPVVLDECTISKKGNYLSKCHNWIISPDLILYGDTMKREDIEEFHNLTYESELLIVMGTGLDIYTHNEFISRFPGNKILINKDDVPINLNVMSYGTYVYDWTDKFIGEFKELL